MRFVACSQHQILFWQQDERRDGQTSGTLVVGASDCPNEQVYRAATPNMAWCESCRLEGAGGALDCLQDQRAGSLDGLTRLDSAVSGRQTQGFTSKHAEPLEARKQQGLKTHATNHTCDSITDDGASPTPTLLENWAATTNDVESEQAGWLDGSSQ